MIRAQPREQRIREMRARRIKSQGAPLPPLPDQQVWDDIVKRTNVAPLAQPQLFTGPITRNLIYHLWPVRGKQWEWNVTELLRRIDLFNGKRIIAIVKDSKTENIQEVINKFAGHDCEFIIETNDRSGEAITFPKLLRAVNSDNLNEVTFYAHGKGVRYEPVIPQAVKRWADVQYQVCLDNWFEVKRQLEQYPITGPFKRKGLFTAHHLLTKWHYSGTFFWLRNNEVFKRDCTKVPRFFGGVEIWPGLYFQIKEAGSLFMNLEQESPYHDPFWTTLAEPAFKEWKRKKQYFPVPPLLLNPVIDGHRTPRTEQIASELNWFIDCLLQSDVKSILTIGAFDGGTEWHIARRFRQAGKDIAITTIDKLVSNKLINTSQSIIKDFSQSHILVNGDSSNQKIQDFLAPKYDAVFIDGDHGYSGARSDWLLAKFRFPKIVGFHDIVDSDWHTQHYCCVSRLWQQIKNTHQTEERSGQNWGGIGLVWFK